MQEPLFPEPRQLARSTDPSTSHKAAKLLGGKAGTMRQLNRSASAAVTQPMTGHGSVYRTFVTLVSSSLLGRTFLSRHGREQQELALTELGKRVLNA